MLACHLRDGAAESEFFAWLEEELAHPKGNHSLSLPVYLSLALFNFLSLSLILSLILSHSLPSSLPPSKIAETAFSTKFLTFCCSWLSSLFTVSSVIPSLAIHIRL
jgi:hypothetical protein